MSFSIRDSIFEFCMSDREPTTFIGNSIAVFINHTSLATKITYLARSILMGVYFAGTIYWKFPVPLATVLPWACGLIAMTMLFQAIVYGNGYRNTRLEGEEELPTNTINYIRDSL
jgi:hypothetical protein